MPIEDVSIGVSGGTPGADANDYVLFDSTKHLSGAIWKSCGFDRAQFIVNNAQAGILKSYWSPDGGTTWNLNSWTAVAANSGVVTGAGVALTPYDFALSGFPDWKLIWTNGGSAQNPWQPTLTLSRGQKQASV